MSDLAAFHALVSGRRGHFRMESGLHASLWLNLDSLFSRPAQVDPFIASLAEALRTYDAQVVCGPLVGGAFLAQALAGRLGADFCFTERTPGPEAPGTFTARYRLGSAFVPLVRGRRVVLVDDVMSAGSSLRATYVELTAAGAEVCAVGALLVLGRTGADHFAREGVPVTAVNRENFDMWPPEQCPLCATHVPLEDMGA